MLETISIDDFIIICIYSYQFVSSKVERNFLLFILNKFSIFNFTLCHYYINYTTCSENFLHYGCFPVDKNAAQFCNSYSHFQILHPSSIPNKLNFIYSISKCINIGSCVIYDKFFVQLGYRLQ